MNVYGQLVAAQIENLTADPAGVPTARVYYNTTSGVAKIYAGSWKTLATTDVALSNPMTTFGDMIYGAIGGAATRLAPGSDGSLLMSRGTGVAPTWSDGAGTATAVISNTTGSQALVLNGTTSVQNILRQSGVTKFLIGVANSGSEFVAGSVAGDTCLFAASQKILFSTTIGGQNQGQIDAGTWSFGSAGVFRTHTMHGNLAVRGDGATDSAISLWGGAVERWHLRANGADNSFEVWYAAGSLSTAKVSPAGVWTIGPASSTQTHRINGNVQVNSAFATDPVSVQFLNGTTVAGIIGTAGTAGNHIAGSTLYDLCIRANSNPIHFSADSGSTSHGLITTTGSWRIGGTAKTGYGGDHHLITGATKISNFYVGNSGGDYASIGYNIRPTASGGFYNYDFTDTASRLNFHQGGFRFFGSASGTGGGPIPETLVAHIDVSGTCIFGRSSGGITHTLNTNTSTTANNGGFTAPSFVVGYITMVINGTTRKIPYYAN